MGDLTVPAGSAKYNQSEVGMAQLQMLTVGWSLKWKTLRRERIMKPLAMMMVQNIMRKRNKCWKTTMRMLKKLEFTKFSQVCRVS